MLSCSIYLFFTKRMTAIVSRFWSLSLVFGLTAIALQNSENNLMTIWEIHSEIKKRKKLKINQDGVIQKEMDFYLP